MVGAVVFDLDGTLVDSSKIEFLREKRQWKNCVRNFHKTYLFDGVAELVEGLQARGISIGIVTSSVSFYAENLLAWHKLKVDTLVAYHDTGRKKPHSAPVDLAIERLNVSREATVAVGDREEDVLAYGAAGVIAVAAGWNAFYEQHPNWNHILTKPKQLFKVIQHLPV